MPSLNSRPLELNHAEGEGSQSLSSQSSMDEQPGCSETVLFIDIVTSIIIFIIINYALKQFTSSLLLLCPLRTATEAFAR